jgi:hypothetical protein
MIVSEKEKSILQVGRHRRSSLGQVRSEPKRSKRPNNPTEDDKQIAALVAALQLVAFASDGVEDCNDHLR